MNKTYTNTSVGLLIPRLALGTIMVMHGWQKFNEWTIAGVTESFTGMGVPMAGIAAPFATFVELIGGILIILGALTRIIAALNIVSMLGAIFFVHAGAFFADQGGYEFVLLLAAASATLALTGAGRYSVDAALLGRRKPKNL